MTQPPPLPTRRRRSSAEVRELVLGAAQEVFAERGYDAATTREIALRAGVTEQVIFNQVESKEQLFTATVLEPFDAFARAHLDAWRSVPIDSLDPREMLSSYIADLFDFTLEHRALFQALGEDRFGRPARGILDRLDTVAREVAGRNGIVFDVAVGVRMVFVATTTLALHHDNLLPEHAKQAIVEELTRALVAGLIRDKS